MSEVDQSAATVSGIARRPVGFDTFADLVDVDLVAIDTDGAGSTTLTFASHLDEAARLAVWERLCSSDDTDQQRRAHVRAAAAADAVNLCAITTAYVLGDPLPDPTYPEEQP